MGDAMDIDPREKEKVTSKRYYVGTSSLSFRRDFMELESPLSDGLGNYWPQPFGSSLLLVLLKSSASPPPSPNGGAWMIFDVQSVIGTCMNGSWTMDSEKRWVSIPNNIPYS